MINAWIAIKKTFSISCWNDFVNGFKEARNLSIEQLRIAAPHANILNVLKLGKDEIRHSRMLAWLWDNQETHMQGPLFFEFFLEALGLSETKYFSERYEVNREKPNRIDISIISPRKFIIYIENKISHIDPPNQLDNEYDSLEKMGKLLDVPLNKCHLVYLTPEGREPLHLTSETDNIFKKTINISYYDIINGLIRAALSERCKSEYIRRLVTDYSSQISHEIKDMIILMNE